MTIWKKEISTEIINKRAKNSFSDHIGIFFTDVTGTSLTASMPVHANTKQPMGILHGGASCALAETVASAAANFCLEDDSLIAVGLEININHIRAVTSGNITGTAKPLHMGKKTHVWEIVIQDEEKNLVAISRLTLAIIQKK